ncbi:hydrolase [Desulfobacter hydrogenophilus]|uniref:Hydrolase n=1 Tax=Desulfobacter hydrogenophilus TaxID=2291 RepID=A0A328FHT6_9BACT|nr:hydrolase [Desulfobacter hydrogenophilus]NDY71485.1 hydrolase [Desulfobacter hydrogenophilus]QBH11871.1 hydrolase [Desulfobacter hydrogenophilus]RAM02515.1 hydrolase [Desulfobacter hydrogenophilus]
MLEIENVVLLIVDIQGKLAHLMDKKEILFKNVQNLIKGSRALDIPILWVEQNPQGLGPTIPEIADMLSDIQPISKMSFSSCRNDSFLQALNALDRKQVLISGIEAHICVYQTAADLVDMGYEVQVVTDAVSSRNLENKEIGLQRMRESGVSLTSVETALFELLKVAEGDQFRQIIRIIK